MGATQGKSQGLSKQQRGVDANTKVVEVGVLVLKNSGISCCDEFACYGIYSKYQMLGFGLVFTKKSCPELELYAASAVVPHGCDHLGYDFRFRLTGVGR